MLSTVIGIGVVVLVFVQAISGAVREFGDALPQIVDEVRHSGRGHAINSGSSALDTLEANAGDTPAEGARSRAAWPTSASPPSGR